MCLSHCVQQRQTQSFGLFFVRVGKTTHTNSGMKFRLHRCENPIFMSNLVLRYQHFSLRRDRAGEDIIGSSIRLDVSYLSLSRCFAESVEHTAYSSVKNRLIWNRV